MCEVKKVFVLMFVLLVWTSNLFSSNYKFRNLGSDYGLSDIQVNDVYVDSRGSVWAATLSGFDRFDGYKFKPVELKTTDSVGVFGLNNIQVIFEDNEGVLWLRLHDNTTIFYNPRTENFTHDHSIFHQDISVLPYGISGLVVDRDSNVWISNSFQGLFMLNTRTNYLTQIKTNANDSSCLSSPLIHSVAQNSSGNIVIINDKGIAEEIDRDSQRVINRYYFRKMNMHIPNFFFRFYIDSDDDMWAYSRYQGGVYHLSKSTGNEKHYGENTKGVFLSNNIVNSIVEDKNGRIWIGTDHGGINIFDKSNNTIEVIQKEEGVSNSISHNTINSLCGDSDGGIWVATFKGGINYYHPQLFQFGMYKKSIKNARGLQVDDINCFAEDKHLNIWFGTNEHGLSYFSRTEKKFYTFNEVTGLEGDFNNYAIVSLCYDSKNRLWIGTYQGGLYMYDGKRISRFTPDTSDKHSLSSKNIWSIVESSVDRLWIGTLEMGLELFEVDNDRFVHYRGNDINSVRSNYVQSMFKDRSNNLWVGTTEGIDCYNSNTGRFISFVNTTDSPRRLQNHIVSCINEDKRGWMWFGTRNGLHAYNKVTDEVRYFNGKDGLPAIVICSILVDENDDLWLSTRKGLVKIRIHNPEDFMHTAVTCRFFNEKDGLQSNIFNIASSFKTSNGEFVFGGINGFNVFHPSSIKESNTSIGVVLTDLRIENASVLVNEPVDNRIILKKALYATKEISLKHNQNALTIQFTSTDYLNPDKVRFRYMLEGINTKWIDANALNRSATYTNLDPGSYQFRVMALGTSGEWNGRITVLDIEIEPPFYLTNWAMIVYALMAIVLLLLLIRIAVRREHWKFKKLQNMLEHERLVELETMKAKFFTNVSHEFRTPLALIIDPIDKLLENEATEELSYHLNLIKRNAQRLLQMVNQLLDFRKMEVVKTTLDLSQGNLIQFLKETVESFDNLSKTKSIHLKFSSNQDKHLVSFDRYKVERIIFNLLSNAIKFTPQSGTVEVEILINKDAAKDSKSLFAGCEFTEIRVSDSGVGIPSDQLNKIFDRFFQSENVGASKTQGSGIGLSIVKEYVQVHKGTIHAESIEGQGSVFVVRIPFEPVDKAALHPIIDAFDNDKKASLTDSKKQIAIGEESFLTTIVLVEDNEDMRLYLKKNLEKYYRVYDAKDGAKGWDLILEKQPSIVVSDIMMPVMNGLELCGRIKNNASTSHIPVLLLTAKTSLENEIEGLEAGADEYVVKPFNFESLEIKIRKLIEIRKAFHNKFNQQFEVAPGEIGITSLDEQFIQKALKLVEEKMTDPEFSVEEMSRDLGMSRSHLYNKLMALTGKPPVEFIRIMRIKRAAQILEKSQLPIASVAYDVGFNNTKYFTKHFKDIFKMLPSEYVKKKRNKDKG